MQNKLDKDQDIDVEDIPKEVLGARIMEMKNKLEKLTDHKYALELDENSGNFIGMYLDEGEKWDIDNYGEPVILVENCRELYLAMNAMIFLCENTLMYQEKLRKSWA